MADYELSTQADELLPLPPDPDLKTFTHRHDILAIGVEAEDASFSVPMTLYHWSPPTVRTITRVVVSPRLLSMIKDCTPLGTFFLGDDFDVSETLTRLLTERGGNNPRLEPEPLTPQVIANLMAVVAEPTQGAFMRFFFFSVLGNNPSFVLGDGLFPVWKWRKPESIYRKGGFWEVELSKVLDDGEWNAGRDLAVLVGGVAEETLQTVRAGNWKSPGFESLTRLGG